MILNGFNNSFLLRINHSLPCRDLSPGPPCTKQIAYQCAAVLRSKYSTSYVYKLRYYSIYEWSLTLRFSAAECIKWKLRDFWTTGRSCLCWPLYGWRLRPLNRTSYRPRNELHGSLLQPENVNKEKNESHCQHCSRHFGLRQLQSSCPT